MSHINVFIAIIIGIILFGFLSYWTIYLLTLIIKALKKYIHTEEVRKETSVIKKSLGEVIKHHRINCNMTQEFVAEQLGVTRQTVSKWETGVSEPNTSNLIQLAKLFDVPADELIKKIHL